jgi:dTMP kinase
MEKNNYPGKFIVLEGLDGSGQSTQAELLKDFLIKKGFEVILTKEPTQDSEAGKKINEILAEKIKIEPKTLQELFAQDRKEHLENLVIPALKEGKFVVSDRYFFSSFAFGSSDGLDLEWLIEINNSFLLPDQTLILKVKPEVCISRIEGRGIEKTLFEKQEKLAKVWQTYEILPQRFENTLIINGEKSIEEVFEEVKKVVLSKFLERKEI